MSFKLLAIRPLEGTDPSLLKGLKPNCIYRFYNEYDYLYEYDENTEKGKSFIDYQKQYFNEASNKEENYLKLENREIIAIKCEKQLPDGFFGENINVSAIVGENGSGKSSLLELFYGFVFNSSVLAQILYKASDKPISNMRGSKQLAILDRAFDSLKNGTKLIRCNVELFILVDNEILCFSPLQINYYNEIRSEMFNIDRIEVNPRFAEIIIESDEIEQEIEALVLVKKKLIISKNRLSINDSKYGVFENDYYKKKFIYPGIFNEKIKVLCNSIEKIEIAESIEKYRLVFYNIVLNYSLYGLNSEVMGSWLDSLFHKNDGYQTPIVINPYREEGNIDINKEYVLGQARLLLNHYAIENRTLIEGIELSHIRFYLDYLKHQYEKSVYNPFAKKENEEDKEPNRIERSGKSFFNIFKQTQDKVGIVYLLDAVFDFYQTNEKGLVNFSALISFDINTIDEIEIKYTGNGTFNYKENATSDSEFFSGNMNSDKEIHRIEYDIFKKYGCTVDKYYQTVVPLQVLNMFYIFKKLYKIVKYDNFKVFEVLYDSKHNGKFSISKREIFEIVLNEEVNRYKGIDFYTIVNEDNRGFFDEIFNNSCERIKQDKEKLKDDRVHIYNDYKDLEKGFDELINLFEKYKLKTEETISSFIVSNSEPIELGHNAVVYLFFRKVKQDSSHTVFKLKQAINYYKTDFFFYIDKIETIKNSEVLSLSIKDSYFKKIIEEDKEDRETQEDIIYYLPLAMVQPNVFVKKSIENNKVKKYEFNALSSGEQQMIQSLLTISYHIFNLKSVVASTSNIAYKEVNIILDEIELYYHPEYQRKYVANLLFLLKKIDKESKMKFNILLSTHSPFILSDIPSQNVLKLKEGKPEVGDNINSFGANIHDLLADEFFLDNGFMGEFAKEKINSIVKFLYLKKSVNELDSNMSNTFFSETMQVTFKEAKEKLSKELDVLDVKYSKEEVEQHIKLIGEPLLAVKMKEMSDIAFKEN